MTQRNYAEQNYENAAVRGETIAAQPINKMATSRQTEMTEAVAQALRDLALSSGDQESLSEFLTEYFSSDDPEGDSGMP